MSSACGLNFPLLLSLCRSITKFNLGKFSLLIFHRQFYVSTSMALSKWEYVKTFEGDETLLPNCWAVGRVDGRGFHKLAKKHNWLRPNDPRGIKLMSRAAKSVMHEYDDIVMAYGQSDEYSFVFRRCAEVFQRRTAKILSTLVSKFSSAFVFYWNDYFPNTRLLYPPSFDGRMVLYPTDKNLRDYLSWRQADCHINNLYNTTFWMLVQKGNLTNNEAEKRLMGTLAADKNEILFSEFSTNYNNEPEVYRKGTALVQKPRTGRRPKESKDTAGSGTASEEQVQRQIHRDEANLIELNCDIIGDQFWTEHPHILLGNPVPVVSKPPPSHSRSTKEIELTI